MAVDTSQIRKELARILDVEVALIAKPEKKMPGWRVCYEYRNLTEQFKIRVGIVEDKDGERVINLYFNNKKVKFEKYYYSTLNNADILMLENMINYFIRS